MPRLAVLGQPVSHSRSPAMQNAALSELGLAPEWAYEAIEVAPEDLAALVARLPDEGFAGVNVTVPHKVVALVLADEASAAARAVGAANTLTFSEGRVLAENTDTVGIVEALPEPPGGKRALVLGAGGSARAAAWALRGAGADVAVWNRTESKARELAGELDVDLVAAPEAEAFDLVLNATTVGMQAANPPAAPGGQPSEGSGFGRLKGLPITADDLKEHQVVVDLVYGTEETQLIAAARAAGAQTVDGLEVLVRQGAASLRLWTGAEPPLDVMRRAARGKVLR